MDSLPKSGLLRGKKHENAETALTSSPLPFILDLGGTERTLKSVPSQQMIPYLSSGLIPGKSDIFLLELNEHDFHLWSHLFTYVLMKTWPAQAENCIPQGMQSLLGIPPPTLLSLSPSKSRKLILVGLRHPSGKGGSGQEVHSHTKVKAQKLH